ncbi:MAG: DUF2905 domain-containing protein [Firmicutes bacterium]|nr:DUF2905 domain-containing protein [Bacillota bacterium]
MGKILLALGAFMMVMGLLLMGMGRLGLGRLPGDIIIRRENFVFYFPVVTTIIISIILSLIFNFFRR